MNHEQNQEPSLIKRIINLPSMNIIAAIIIYFITWILDKYFDKSIVNFYYFTLIIALLVFAWLTVSQILSLKRNDSELKRHHELYEDKLQSLRIAFENSRYGFIPLDEKERVTRIIAALSGSHPCNKISVIGKTLDYLDEEELKPYLNAYEERMRKNQSFEYRRITSRQINKEGYLYKHYLNLFDSNSDNKEFSILLMNEFSIANTYIIIDDRELIVSLHIIKEENNVENSTAPPEFMEMKASFLCLDKSIIAGYQAHFDGIFNQNKANVCKTKNDFLEEIASNINKDKLRAINKNMKGIIAGSLEEVYFSIRINELEQQFLSIQRKHKLTIDHTNSNGSIIKAFCVCLDNLRQGDAYFTISHSGFWQSVLQPNRMVRPIDFVQSTFVALDNGASIQRLFLLQPSKIQSWLSYIKSPNVIISQENISDFNDYKQFINILSLNMKFYEYIQLNNLESKFRFGILFREDNGSGDFATFNYALILRQNPNEYVAFSPDKEVQKKNDHQYSIYRTSVLFLNRKEKEMEMQNLFNEKISQMNKLVKEYNVQRDKRTLEQKEFIDEVQKIFLTDNKYLKLFDQKKLGEWVFQTELMLHPPLKNFQ